MFRLYMDEPQEEVKKPIPGVVARILKGCGIKSETEAITELKAEVELYMTAANGAQTELEATKATLATAQASVSALNAKVTALESVVPGIASTAAPASHLQEHITKAAATQIASLGMDPGTAPGVNSKAADEPEKLTLAEFNKLTPVAQTEYMRVTKAPKLKES